MLEVIYMLVVVLMAGLLSIMSEWSQPLIAINSVICHLFKKMKKFFSEESAKKGIYLAVGNAFKWTMPIRN